MASAFAARFSRFVALVGLLLALFPADAGKMGGKMGGYRAGDDKTPAETSASWEVKKATVLENCSYWLDDQQYSRIWEQQKLAPEFERMHDEFDIRCTKKPATAHDHLGWVDASAAAKLLESYGPSVWLEEKFRQERFAVHSETESIVFLWKGRFFSQRLVLPMWAEWEALINPIVKRFAEAYGYRYEDVDVWKAMLAKLPAGKDIKVHSDINPLLAFAHRIHWCVSSEEGTTTVIGDETFTEKDLPQGTIFQFNNVMPHKVLNGGHVDRVHLVLDIVPKKMAGISSKEVQTVKGEL